MKPAYQGRYESIKITKKKRQVICPGNQFSKYPYQGIGFKLGDPFALTYKLYISKKLGFVLDVGRAASGLYNTYYLDNFDNRSRPDTVSFGNQVNYFSHQPLKDGVLQAKFLYNRNFKKMEALNLYVGAGMQYRWYDISYNYIFETQSNFSELRKYQINNTTFGPAVTTGIEFTHPFVSISSFFEFEVYYDMLANPGWTRLMGGVGLRYNF